MRMLVALVLLVGCSGDELGPGGPDGPDGPDPAESVDSVGPSAKGQGAIANAWASDAWSFAVDPTLDEAEEIPLLVDGQLLDGYTCTVSIAQNSEVVRELTGEVSSSACVAIWDGRDSAGEHLPPGMVEVTTALDKSRVDELDPIVVTQFVELVRIGLKSVQLEATTGSREGVVFRAADGVRGGFVSVPDTSTPFRMSQTWDEAGERLQEILPWEDLVSPPLNPAGEGGLERENLNLPTAFVAGSLVQYSAILSEQSTSTMEFRAVSAERNTVEDGIALVDETSAVPAVGKYDVAVKWQFQGKLEDGEWFDLPGSLTTTHRIYGLAREPVFDYDDVRHQPWVDVLDLVTGWVDGTTSDADEVGARIVQGVYFDLGLTYDRNRGASFYTSYPRGLGPNAQFDLSRFQERMNGDIINCSDAGSIVSTFANMVGLDYRYHILQNRNGGGFDLNFIQAIGWEEFTEFPFFSGRGAFSYHAVVGPADGRFFDATLALDGDGMPESAPSTLLLAQGMSSTDYLNTLSSVADQVRTRVDEQVRIR